jgi:hypothetical protein
MSHQEASHQEPADFFRTEPNVIVLTHPDGRVEVKVRHPISGTWGAPVFLKPAHRYADGTQEFMGHDRTVERGKYVTKPAPSDEDFW